MIPTNDRTSGDDPEFFDTVFHAHQKVLYAYLFGQVGNQENAEDLLQQVFVRVWQHVDTARQKPEDALRYWLFSIASNIVVDFRRKHMRQQVFQHPILEVLPDSKQDIEESTVKNDALGRISKAIQKLPSDLRIAFTMSVLGEMSSEEVGMVLGKPAGTIRYQISEARKRIAQEVGI